MNHIFHYHVTSLLAFRAGYSAEISRVIAQSSRMVDTQCFKLIIETDKYSYPLLQTHHYGLAESDQDIKIWKPFHFFPASLSSPVESIGTGAPSLKKEYKLLWTPWCTSPKSEPAKELLIAALKTGNPYRIGIALHTFSDTWAHQSFSGDIHPINRMDDTLGLPCLGHAQAESKPDIFNLEWHDMRREDGFVNNRTRFLDAARFVYRYLCTANKKNFSDENSVLAEIETICRSESTSPYHDLTSRIQNTINKGIHGIHKVGKITNIKILQELKENKMPVQGFLTGANDKIMMDELRNLFPLHETGTFDWFESAIKSNSGFKFDLTEINTKLFWLKAQTKQLGGLFQTSLAGTDTFFDSDLYRFNEAAKEHLNLSHEIFKNI